MVQRRLPRPAELAPLLRPAPFVRDATARRLRRAASIADLREIVEQGPTEQLFSDPRDDRTLAYVEGRFG